MSVAVRTVADMFHPWRALRSRPDITVEWRKLALDEYATTNGRDRIWMDPRQTQVERRCTIAHELVHIELEHTDGCTPREDREVDLLVARRLIAMDDLLSALRWADDLYTVADELWVDEATLLARYDGLTADERARIVRLYEEVERGC